VKKLLSLILLLLLNLTSTIQASTTEEISDYQKQLEENQKKQQELQQKIEGLQAEERSLQNQIDYMDSQIALTNLKIDEAQTKILERQRELEGLATDIETLIARIKRIEESVRYQNEVYGQRLRARYKSSKVSALEILFGADSLSDVFARLKYLRMMEQQDRRLISQMNETQFNYKNQKALLEETKKQVEIVKAELEQEKANLEARRADLDFQKKGKEELLVSTRGEESEYQRQLALVQAEQRSIEQALSEFISKLIEQGVPSGGCSSRGYDWGAGFNRNVHRRPRPFWRLQKVRRDGLVPHRSDVLFGVGGVGLATCGLYDFPRIWSDSFCSFLRFLQR